MIRFERCRSLRTASKPSLRARYAALGLVVAACAGCSGGGDRQDAGAPVASSAAPERADPLLPLQWHLVNTGQIGDPALRLRGSPGVDLNVAPAWRRGFDGRGVTVAVVDNGIEIGHEDLRANIAPGLGFNYRTGTLDPTPAERSASHGTMVAGVIAAARNGTGGLGVAPGAKLAGLNMLSTQYASDAVDALGRGIADNSIAISNNSWGPDSLGMPAPIDAMLAAIVRKGVDQGRAGKGIVYVFAAGNSELDPLEFLESSEETPRFTSSNFYSHRPAQSLIVCAVNANGIASSYSASGSNLLVCAPSSETADFAGVPPTPGITTTEPYGRYSHAFGGTSAAAPAVSGVVALMLQANPNLTWRDVRLILARTARILPSMERDPNAQWVRTGAINAHTGKPYRYSTRYGFGLVDASAAVSYAERFMSVGGSSQAFWERNCNVSFREGGPSSGSEASSRNMEQTLPIRCGSQTVEFLDVDITLEHPNFRALRVTLESPLGTKIVLSPEYPRCGRAFELRGESRDFCSTASFGHRYRTHAVTALDEPASGDWLLRIEDTAATGVPIRLRSALLQIT